MTESITNRVGRLVAGGFNAIVDAVENVAPETIMEQAIREIDDAVSQVRAELGKQLANKHLVSKRISQENAKHEELSERIEHALKEGRDDLAEVVISKQLDIEAQIPVLEQTLAETSAREKELEGFIRALQAKKREMHDELSAYRQSQVEAKSIRIDQSDGSTASGGGVIEQVERATSAFDRVLSKQTGLRSKASTRDEENEAKLAELEDIARKNRIQERLLAAKGELQNS